MSVRTARRAVGGGERRGEKEKAEGACAGIAAWEGNGVTIGRSSGPDARTASRKAARGFLRVGADRLARQAADFGFVVDDLAAAGAGFFEEAAVGGVAVPVGAPT